MLGRFGGLDIPVARTLPSGCQHTAVTFFLLDSMDLWLIAVGFLARLSAFPSGPAEKSHSRAVPSLDALAKTSRFFGFQARQLT